MLCFQKIGGSMPGKDLQSQFAAAANHLPCYRVKLSFRRILSTHAELTLTIFRIDTVVVALPKRSQFAAAKSMLNDTQENKNELSRIM